MTWVKAANMNYSQQLKVSSLRTRTVIFVACSKSLFLLLGIFMFLHELKMEMKKRRRQEERDAISSACV